MRLKNNSTVKQQKVINKETTILNMHEDYVARFSDIIGEILVIF
jgi:hypothetical protein